MTLAEIGAFISQVGFPVAVAVWLIMRDDRCIKFLEKAHEENRQVLNRITENQLTKN